MFGLRDFDNICEPFPERVRRLDHGNAVGLKDVDVHLKTGHVSARQRQQARRRRHIYLEVWHQPPGLKVQRVLVHSQLPAHHLLVVELKLDVAARRNVDLGLKRL